MTPLQPSPWRAFGWLVVFFILSLFALLVHRFGYDLILGLSQPDLAPEDYDALVQAHFTSPFGLGLYYCLQFAVVLPALIHAADFPDQPWQRTLGLRPVAPLTLLRWMLLWLVAMTGLNALLNLLGSGQEDFMVDMLARPHWLMLVAVGVLAPVLEELLFRGYLWRAFRATWLGASGTLVITSVLFSFSHATQYTWFGLAQIFGLALLLGMARERTGSVLVPMGIHTGQNLLASLVMLQQ